MMIKNIQRTLVASFILQFLFIAGVAAKQPQGLALRNNRLPAHVKKGNQVKNASLDLNQAAVDPTLCVIIKPYRDKKAPIKTVPLASLYQQEQPELRFVFIVPSHNNALWYEKNLTSIFMQKYTNYHVIYIDDASTDNTANLVESFVKQHGMEQKVTLIRNEQRMHMAYNRYKAVHLCADTDICLALDGDDWMPHENVLSVYNAAYKDKNVWLTYGRYKTYPRGAEGASREVKPAVLSSGTVRKAPWRTTHFKTHYAWLFKNIEEECFKRRGQFVTAATDYAMMFPMVEMAGIHCKFIPEVTYIYNCANTTSLYKKERTQKNITENSAFLRRKKPYDPIVIEACLSQGLAT